MKIKTTSANISLTSDSGLVAILIDVDIPTNRYEDVLFEIWEYIGDEGINKILAKEGKIMIDIADLPPKQEIIEEEFEIPLTIK